jgi:hypothetical protein
VCPPIVPLRARDAAATIEPATRSTPQARCAHLDEVSRKWRIRAERRLPHFVELCETGRWKRYFSEEDFLRRMREAMAVSTRWAEIAAIAEEEQKERRAAA